MTISSANCQHQSLCPAVQSEIYALTLFPDGMTFVTATPAGSLGNKGDFEVKKLIYYSVHLSSIYDSVIDFFDWLI